MQQLVDTVERLYSVNGGTCHTARFIVQMVGHAAQLAYNAANKNVCTHENVKHRAVNVETGHARSLWNICVLGYVQLLYV